MKDETGVSVVEFALIAPVMLTMLFGVLQAGVWLQNYNAMRSIMLDSVRAITIEYQNENLLTDEQIRRIVVARSTTSPYFLDSDRLSVEVDRLVNSRITGTTEVELRVTYSFDSFLPFLNLPGTSVVYERPIFVTI